MLLMFSARVATPRKKQKRNEWRLWSVWVPVKVRHSAAAVDGNQSTEKLGSSGSKDPSPRAKRKSYHRGCRGGRRRGALARLPAPPLPSKVEASRRERGGGSRQRHFLAAFERSYQRLTKVAEQVLDIKARAESRRMAGLKPALPAKAALGLARRQWRVKHASVWWGDAYARFFGLSRLQGRKCWRDAMWRYSLVTDVKSARADSYSSGYVYMTQEQAEDLVSVGASTVASDRARQEREGETILIPRGFCPVCGRWLVKDLWVFKTYGANKGRRKSKCTQCGGVSQLCSYCECCLCDVALHNWEHGKGERPT